jgi:hypothetical protein
VALSAPLGFFVTLRFRDKMVLVLFASMDPRLCAIRITMLVMVVDPTFLGR